MSIGSELKKFGKKFKKEMRRFGDSFSDMFKYGIGGKPPEIPPAPTPPPEIERISAEESDEIKRRRRARVSGRRRTIITGDLTPFQSQKTSLLGRTSKQ